jgi:hypothetical protein
VAWQGTGQARMGAARCGLERARPGADVVALLRAAERRQVWHVLVVEDEQVVRRVRIGGEGFHKNAKGPAPIVHAAMSTSHADACVARLVPLDTKKYSSGTQKLRFLVGVPIWPYVKRRIV